MKSGKFSTIAIITVVLAVLCGMAISAQDKYTVQVPNGLAFSDFRGYENWQASPSARWKNQRDKVIVANPVMIDAYRAGVPGNGKPFPDGSKIAKIQWKPKKSAEAHSPVTVSDTLKSSTLSRRIARDLPIPADGDMPSFTITPHPKHSRPTGAATNCGYACHTA